MDDESLQRLIEAPTESLRTEVKRWLDLSTAHGQFHLIRACMALRNGDGGQLLIGFDDATGAGSADGCPGDVREHYHPDTVQSLVASYSSQRFEIDVRFVERDGRVHPVLIVEGGVRTPVAVKNPLVDKSGPKPRDLFARGDVFVRTLESGNVASSSKARPDDWERLMQICFDNREADIGRFVRRQLGTLSSETLQRIIEALGGIRVAPPSAKDRLTLLLDRGLERYKATVDEKRPELPEHGSWEVALIMEGADPERLSDREFLSLLGASNPRYTGWAIWLDTSLQSAKERPRLIEDGWEALIVRQRFIEFQRMRANGEFYQRNALEDDLEGYSWRVLNPQLMIYRVAEAIAVGLAFADAMKIVDGSTLHFGFRWSGLKDRKLPPRWSPNGDEVAHDDSARSFVSVRADTAVNAIGPVVEEALRPLMLAFNGFRMNSGVCEHWAQQFLDRKI